MEIPQFGRCCSLKHGFIRLFSLSGRDVVGIHRNGIDIRTVAVNDANKTAVIDYPRQWRREIALII
jgi:hypothetical protein